MYIYTYKVQNYTYFSKNSNANEKKIVILVQKYLTYEIIGLIILTIYNHHIVKMKEYETLRYFELPAFPAE